MSEGTDGTKSKGLFDTINKMLFGLAGIILILFVYMRLKSIMDGFKTDKWPPEIDSCPNMWVKKGNKCENVLHIGNVRCGGGMRRGDNGQNTSINFNDAQYKDPRNKCKWAKYDCNVDWDGYDKLC